MHPIAGVLLTLTLAGAGQAQTDETFRGLSLEDLLAVDVTLAARRPEPIGTAEAAISVIQREDIRRSGVTTIADALALADGLFVGRFNNGTWAVGARGFTGTSPNKLLVMIDGRTVYSELLTGVFWNTVDYVLEDIDRIEMIRGPGAALWGANAVNGVVNIITRSTRETQGAFVQLGSGNEDRALTDVRYGGNAGEGATWRVYGKFAQRDAQEFSTGESAGDARRRGQVGLRLDGGSAGRAEWMVKADVFHSRDELVDRPPSEFTDVSLHGKWSASLGSSRLDIQSFYRREQREVIQQLRHELDTADVDLQHAFETGRHRIIWGGGARLNRDRTRASAILAFAPPSRSYALYSAFAQDQVSILPNRLSLTVGAKLEHNAFSGADLQPSLRGRVRVGQSWLWGAISRATRRPTRFDEDIRITVPAGLVLIEGNPEFASEKLTAYEGGYRLQPASFLAVDVSVFVHRLDELRSQEALGTGPLPAVLGNTLNGRSRGIEIAADVQPVPWWRTHLSYTRLGTRITRDAGSRDATGGVSEANDPSHMFSLATAIDLPGKFEADVMARAVGALPHPLVPAYGELNARLAWQFSRSLELSVVGQDLVHDRHPEFGTPFPRREEFQRSVRGVLTWRFAGSSPAEIPVRPSR